MNGFFHYKGIRTLQPATAIECFEEFLRLNKPERIVEIGTASGGLTTILADFTDVPIHTFDIVSNANLSRTGTLSIHHGRVLGHRSGHCLQTDSRPWRGPAAV